MINATAYSQSLTTDRCNLDIVIHVRWLCSSSAVFIFKETKSSLQDGKLSFWGISDKIIHLICRMLHRDFIWIASKPPIILLLTILKILKMSWETYVL
jgi:hypothetical protein